MNPKTILAYSIVFAVALLSMPMLFAHNQEHATQSGAASPVSFDVASVKAWQPNQPVPKVAMGVRFSPGSVYAPCADLRSLVSYAYHLRLSMPVMGLPDWARTPCGPNTFTVDAAMPIETTQDQSRLMMQALLKGRFKMSVHWEKKEMQVLVLVIGPGGFKGEPYDPKTAVSVKPESLTCPEEDPGCWRSHGASTMSQLADFLSFVMGRPVIDKTGLTDKYATNFVWASNEVETSSLPSLPAVLREKFGLLLKSETAPMDVLVIDHVERPSAN